MLQAHEIDHLLYLVKWFGCKSEHADMPHQSECERLHDKLVAMKVADQVYWRELQSPHS